MWGLSLCFRSHQQQRGHGLDSHPTDWRNWGSNSEPGYKGSGLSTAPQRLKKSQVDIKPFFILYVKLKKILFLNVFDLKAVLWLLLLYTFRICPIFF